MNCDDEQEIETTSHAIQGYFSAYHPPMMPRWTPWPIDLYFIDFRPESLAAAPLLKVIEVALSKDEDKYMKYTVKNCNRFFIQKDF